MQLTQDQKELIADFLRAQDESFGELPADKRVQILSQIKTRIREELFALQVDTVTDKQVTHLLSRMKVSIKPKDLQPQPIEPTPPAEIETKDKTLEVSPPTWEPQEPESQTQTETDKPQETTSSPDEETQDVEPTQESPTEESAEVQTIEQTKESIEPDTPETQLDESTYHWLGVCENLATRTSQPPKIIRLLFFIAGLLTGPIALTLYLLIYTADSRKAPSQYPPKVPFVARIAQLRLIGIAVGMFAVSWVIEFAAAFAFLNYFGRLPELGVWGAMTPHDGKLLILVLVLLLPIATLSALPLAHRWGNTFTLILNAGLAIYAVIISISVAALMVGFALNALTLLAE